MTADLGDGDLYPPGYVRILGPMALFTARCSGVAAETGQYQQQQEHERRR